VTLNLAEMTVVKSQPSVCMGVIYFTFVPDRKVADLSVVCSLDNARRNLKEKRDGLKKTEQSYKKDEATFETLKKTVSKLEVV